MHASVNKVQKLNYSVTHYVQPQENFWHIVYLTSMFFRNRIKIEYKFNSICGTSKY